MSTPDDIAGLITAAWRDIHDADHCLSLRITPATGTLHSRLAEVTLALADLTAQLAEAQAVALEQAANRMPLYLRGTYGGDVDSSKAFEWLHARADAIRAEGETP